LRILSSAGFAGGMDGNGILSQSSKTNEELALELQELRQFCVALIYNFPDTILPQATKDYWWEKLASYQDVRNG
jgi:hypothetical protein